MSGFFKEISLAKIYFFVTLEAGSKSAMMPDGREQGSDSRGKRQTSRTARVPEEEEIGHPRTAANTTGTASATNEHLFPIQSHLVLSLLYTKKRSQLLSLPNSP